MSWLFSQALVEEYSPGTCSGGVPSAPLSVMPTKHKFWRNDKTMEPSKLSQFGLTCSVLTADHGEALLMSYLEASHARTSQQPAQERASTALDRAFGAKWLESSTRYDLDSCSWRTHLCLWDEALPWSSVTLPNWGMTRAGYVYRHPTSERPINATDFGLWPTPTVTGNNNRPGASKKAGWGLSTAAKLWTTPAASDATRGGRITPAMTGTSLAQQVNTPSHWPTPLASDWKRNGAPGDHRRNSPSLGAMVQLWPTPNASDANKWSNQTLADRIAKKQQVRLNTAVSPEGGKGGQLNPTWVEWLMGWPTGWTDLKPLAMARFHEWQRQHSPCSSIESEEAA